MGHYYALLIVFTIVATIIIMRVIVEYKLQQLNKYYSLSPTTGYEPDWDPQWWNSFSDINDHNCYDYAFGNVQFDKSTRTQPGSLKKFMDDDSETQYTCDLIVNRVLEDHPDIREISFDDKCNAGEYKIAILASPGEVPYSVTSDYHFMRQDSNGLWSHKPGKNMPINTDSDGMPIYSPDKANMNFYPFNYNQNCGYWCINKSFNQRFEGADAAAADIV